ncbi:MAG: hypothetical protein KJP23_11000 [Deltaproteobacteria bacterium]|nr:hypothetical protein [Deltaproteobacteria bacterium]
MKINLTPVSDLRFAFITNLSIFTFDNLGIPQNPGNPAGIAPDFVDPGLGGFLMNAGYPEDVYLSALPFLLASPDADSPTKL